jgi:amidase
MQNAIDLAGMLRRREVSAREVISAHIERIEAFDPAINAVVTRTFDSALARASAADEAMARGEPPGLLHGLPVAHKDLADTAGVRTTYGSPLFAVHVPDRDALVAVRTGLSSRSRSASPHVAGWGGSLR